MRKVNYLAADKLTAISSYGEEFSVKECVRHEDVEAGTAEITSFKLDEARGEVVAFTTKGYAHLDFLIKVNSVPNNDTLYWKKRCALAEKCLEESPCDTDVTVEQIQAHEDYRIFKINNREPKN